MTRGAKKLSDAGGTQHEKAQRLGVEQQTVSRWLAHGVVPNGKQLIKIEQEYGIPVGDWLIEAPEDAPKGADEGAS